MLMTLRAGARLPDLIHFKTLFWLVFFFPFSFFLLSNAAAISSSIVFIAESRERVMAEGGEIRLPDAVQTLHRAWIFAHRRKKINQKKKTTINQPNDPSLQQVRKCLRCKWLRVYKAASVATLVNWNPDMYKRLVGELLWLRRLRIDPPRCQGSEVDPGGGADTLEERAPMMSLQRAWRIQLWWI